MRTRRIAAFVIILVLVALLEARLRDGGSGPEANVIAALTSIVSGEEAYAAGNGGFYDTLTCLHTGTCTPGSHVSAGFFDAEIVSRQEWRGYRFEFHAGPRPVPSQDGRWSPTSMTRFAVVAFPTPRLTIPHRAFCVDDRRVIYFHPAHTRPQVEDARCADTSNPLRSSRPSPPDSSRHQRTRTPALTWPRSGPRMRASPAYSGGVT